MFCLKHSLFGLIYKAIEHWITFWYIIWKDEIKKEKRWNDEGCIKVEAT